MSQTAIRSHPIPKRPATPPGEIVLREWGDRMWATHFHNFETGGYGSGHYFESLEEAEADFEKRVVQWTR